MSHNEPIDDVEKFQNDLIDILQHGDTGLGAQLETIMIEKHDDIQLDTPKNDAYFDSMADAILNRKLFIWYGFSNIGTIQNAPVSAQEVTMFFSIVYRHDNDKGNSTNKTLRYIRAIQAAFCQNFKKMKYAGTIEITPFAPTDIQDNSNSYNWKVGGVEVTGTIKL